MLEKKNNPFKDLELSIQEVPAHMKKKVMGDIAMAKLVMEMATLFTYNYIATIEGMMKTKTKTKTKK